MITLTVIGVGLLVTGGGAASVAVGAGLIAAGWVAIGAGAVTTVIGVGMAIGQAIP